MAFLTLFLASLLSGSPAAAAAPELIPCVAAAKPGDSVSSMLSRPERFDCTTPQNRFQPGDYWVRMDVPETAQEIAGPYPVLRIASLWDEGMSLSTIHRDGSISQYDSETVKKKMRPRLGSTAVLTLPAGKPPITTLLAHVEGSAIVRGVLVAPHLSAGEEAIRFEMAMAVLYAGFGGLCIAMLVYNLALWRAMRQRFLLAYCAMVGAMMSYAFFTSGGIHYFADGWTGADRLRFTIPLLALSAATALLFFRSFFADSPMPRWLGRATVIQATLMVAVSLFYSAIAPAYVKIIDPLYLFGFLSAAILFCAYLWFAWRQKNPFFGYFLAAWAVPVLAAAVRLAYSWGLLPYNIIIENNTLIGFAIEALISSLAIGERVRLLAQARDRAESAEVNALLMADTDPLTGLLNRRAFLRTILEHRTRWTLVLLDVDHFKRVNDTLGHAGGDDAITSIASVMLANAPNGSLVARIGGEEFAIGYLSHTVDTFAAEKLLADVRAINLPEGYRITASVGIADRFVTGDEDWKILYRAADMALYRAKSGGRDRFFSQTAERVAA